MARKANAVLSMIVVHGDDEYQKITALTEALNSLLPPDVDRALALSTYEGGRSPDQGGPTIAAVMEDLATLPFLSDRRVVVVREADDFVSAHRERLERYVEAPPPTGTLVLECRSFPKGTRLYKATVAGGGQIRECKRLTGRSLIEFVHATAKTHNKRIDPGTAGRLVDLTGQEAGLLAAEIEKLAIYVGDRPAITDQDIDDLVGQSREEKIFAVMDAAAAGRLPDALRCWHDTLATDSAAAFKAVGGIAFVIRRWLSAHRDADAGVPLASIAPRMMMWGRERELQALLRRLPAPRLRRALAAVAELDSQAKSGQRSIETGVEQLLVGLAAPAR